TTASARRTLRCLHPTTPPPNAGARAVSAADFNDSTLVEHLVELRARLVRGLLGLGVALLALLPFSRTLYTHLATPLVSQLPAGQSMIATNPAGAFFAPLKLTFFTALFVAVPWL